jgi:hypothetical protein
MTVYRSGNVDQAIADAQSVIAEHRAEAATACCAACGMAVPCPKGRAASDLLTAMGLRSTEPPPNSGLLTHSWRLVLGVGGQRSAAMKVGQR